MEPHIRRHILPEYLRENDIGFVEVYDPTHTYRSKEREHELVNVDGFVMLESGQVCGLEIKYHGGHRLKEYGGVDGDEVPDAYYVQAQHGMSCTGLKMWMHFAIEGHRRIIRWIPRNDEFIAWLRTREAHYWEIVKYNDPLLFPAPGGTDADMDALMEMGSPEMEGVIDLSEADDLLEQYTYLGEEISDRDHEREQIKQRIVSYLGQYRKGESEHYRVGFTRTEQRRVDIEKMRRDHRETVEQYTTWAEVGRLSVRRRKS
jgi:predicted phage-related endonuclease